MWRLYGGCAALGADGEGEGPAGCRRRSSSPPAALRRWEVRKTAVDRAAGVDRVVVVGSPSIGDRAEAIPMGWNKSLRPVPRRGGAHSGEAVGLGRQSSTGPATPDAWWRCTGVVRIWIRSVRCRRSEAEVLWWARWLEMSFFAGDGRRQRQIQGQRSTGMFPSRRARTRPWFPSVGTGPICGSQSPSMAMVLLLPLVAWLTALPSDGDGGVRAGVLEEGDEQGPMDLFASSVFFGVLLARGL